MWLHVTCEISCISVEVKRESIVGIVNIHYRLDDRGFVFRFQTVARNLFAQSPYRLWGPPDTGSAFPAGKWPKSEADDSPSASVWIYTSTPPYSSMAVVGTAVISRKPKVFYWFLKTVSCGSWIHSTPSFFDIHFNNVLTFGSTFPKLSLPLRICI